MQYEIRALSFAEILDMGFRIVRNHPIVLIGMCALTHIPNGFFSAYIEEEIASGDPQVLIGFSLWMLVFSVFTTVISAALTDAICDLYRGQQASIRKSLRAAFSIFFPIVGTSFLWMLALTGGFILLFFPGIYLFLVFLLFWQVMIIERNFGTRALGRSRKLMQGNLLRGLGIIMVAFLVMMVLSAAVEVTLGFVPLVKTLAAGIVAAATGAYLAAVQVVLYFDIRCRKEDYDLEHLAQQIEANLAPTTPEPIG